MTEANQATLEYVPVAGGGSCFRISLAPPARTSAAAPVAAGHERRPLHPRVPDGYI